MRLQSPIRCWFPHRRAGWQGTGPDLLHLARWAPGHRLTSTPQRVADRLGVPVERIITTLTGAAQTQPQWFVTVPPVITAGTEFDLAPFRATGR